jgi:hypothetical protein
MWPSPLYHSSASEIGNAILKALYFSLSSIFLLLEVAVAFEGSAEIYEEVGVKH